MTRKYFAGSLVFLIVLSLSVLQGILAERSAYSNKDTKGDLFIVISDSARRTGTNTIYERLYCLPPANCVGEGLIVSFDILNCDPYDASEGSLILDRAIIETLSVPVLP